MVLMGLALIVVPRLEADWQEVAGFTRLQLLAGGELPLAPSAGLSHVEAPLSAGIFEPDKSSPLFVGKMFFDKSGASGVSFHATHVATNFYGSGSFLSGTSGVDLYEANNWLGTGFLNFNTSNVPLTETRAVENHSWVGSTSVSSSDTEIGRRLDYAINLNGFVCVVGSDNEGSTVLPQLLCQTYNTISVGRDDGGHSAGFTTLDGTGRIKPDIVAPSASPEYASSWTTPMVASAAGLVVARLEASPYFISGAVKPRVAKALLMATAVKSPAWANTSIYPLDPRYGAGVLNIHHAYQALRAGRAVASGSALANSRGWAAESVAGNSTKTYFFTIAPGIPVPFCGALTWHRNVTTNKPMFSARTWSSALSDLNLQLYNASGFTLGSVVAESLSTVDNVELVNQPSLPPGEYALVVQNSSTTATSYALAWHSLPVVTIATTIPIAREIDGQAGLITVTRTGDTILPLYVPLDISGTAVAGTDYQALPASVTIPAGQTSVNLQITPVSDNLAQGDRSVMVGIALDFALVRDAAQSATVTIQDKPFDAWRFANFTLSELSQPEISSENADPDGDQLVNLVEYALGLPPKVSSNSTLHQSDASGYLTLSASKNTAGTDILWNAQVTDDLLNWDPAIIEDDTTEDFSARDTVPSSSAGKRFIRLKITRP